MNKKLLLVIGVITIILVIIGWRKGWFTSSSTNDNTTTGNRLDTNRGCKNCVDRFWAGYLNAKAVAGTYTNLSPNDSAINTQRIETAINDLYICATGSGNPYYNT